MEHGVSADSRQRAAGSMQIDDFRFEIADWGLQAWDMRFGM